MAILLTMPSLSPTMESGVISALTKRVGEHADIGELFAEIETDKALMEYELADEGYVRALLVEVGQELKVGEVLAILAESMDEDITEILAQAKSGATTAPTAPKAAVTAVPTPAPAPTAVPTPAPAPTAVPTPGSLPVLGADERVRISPYAKKLAAEKGIDPRGLNGSGPKGRIVAADVEAAPASSNGVGMPAQSIAFQGEAYRDEPMNMMRRSIAKKMFESKTTTPHFQARSKVRMEALLAARGRIKQDFPDMKVSINDLLIKACATALRLHPNINCQFLGDSVRYLNSVDIAVAVGIDDGLITPVIHHADRKGLLAISKEMRDLAGRARDKKLQPEEYQGGGFTISNLGMYGIHEFNAIINTPQVCILAVSGMVEEPVVDNGNLAVGKTMNITLSSDHRVVDGVAAATFLGTLTQLLQNPTAILL